MVKFWSERVFVVVFIGIIAISCKTVKTITVTKNSNTIEKVYNDLKQSEFNYKNLNIKFNVTYEKKDQTMSLKGNIKIQKDSVIWVSLSPGLGIEAARLMCTTDSVYFLDKLNGSLTKGKYEYIKNLYKMDVDYHSLQSILTNNFFIYPSSKEEKNVFVNSFKISKDSIELAVYRKDETSIENLINVNKSNSKIKSYLINDVPRKRSMNVSYKMNPNAELKNFPGFIDIRSQNEDKFLILNIEYTKIAVDEEISFPFKVPASYRVIVQ